MGHTSGPVDPLFGQSRILDFSGDNVDPAAVAYLRNVRNEALCTSAVGLRNLRNNKKTNISYDDEVSSDLEGGTSNVLDPLATESTPLALAFDTGEVLSWFRHLRTIAAEYHEPFQGYDSKTLDLLLFNLKEHIALQEHPEPSVVRLGELLREVKPPENNDSLQLDEKWAAKLLSRLKRRTFTSIDNLRLKINSQLPIPVRAKAWNIHISLNEPTHEFLQRMSKEQLFTLLQYMEEHLYEQLGTDSETDHCHWLLYLLLHLPERLTANETSRVRSLAKVARNVLEMQVPLKPYELPLELEEHQPPDSKLTFVHLTVLVVAIHYGQKDLLA